MRQAFDLYLRFIRIQLRSQLVYKISFIFDILAQGIGEVIFFLTIALVLQKFQNIAGWSIGEIAFLWGLIDVSFGVMDMLFSGFDPGGFSLLIRKGQFDIFLLRPVSVTLQVLGSRFVTRRLGRILEGAVIFAIALATLDVHWTIGKILYLPVIVASLVCFFGGLFIFGSTLIFWTIQPIEAVNVLTYGGSEMMSYPMSIYPKTLQRFFTYIIPAIFLNYYPALYLLDRPELASIPKFAAFLSPVAGVSVLAAALLFWNFGVRHYQGTGT